MAIQPSPRLAGSSHVLRFQGGLMFQIADGVQTVNAEVPNDAVADVSTPVVFALADMTDLTDTQRRLPASIFDDSTPAGEAPHALSIGGPSGVGGISAPSGKTWMQNIRVRAVEDPDTAGTPLIARFDELIPICTLDGAPGSGLGLEQNTGTPCVTLGIHFTAAGIVALIGQGPGSGGEIPIVVEIEIPHTPQR